MPRITRFEARQKGIHYIRQHLNRMTVNEKALAIGCLRSTKQYDVIVHQLAGELTALLPRLCRQAELETLFLVINVLHEYNPASIDGSVLACIARRLIDAEVVPGGPYKTQRGKTEPLTNAYIAICMQWAGKPLPNVLDCISAHFSARCLQTAAGPLMALWRGPMSHAQLLERQEANGAWPPAVIKHAGMEDMLLSSVATTLLALGVLQDISTSPLSKDIDAHSRHILALVHEQMLSWHQPLPARSLERLALIRAADTQHEITSLPHIFADSINVFAKTDRDLCDMLGVANVFIWIAYTIYDDFLDEEGDPGLLPIANISTRKALRIYAHTFPAQDDYRSFLAEIFAKTEAANAWEVANCRFKVTEGYITILALPDLCTLQYTADRAFFHALGPMIILARQGVRSADPTWDTVRSAFNHYLIARQLNDDLHDWREDLKKGHITYVIVDILRRAVITPGKYRYTQVLARAQQVFWQQALPDLCALTLDHIAQARHDFMSVGVSLDRGGLGGLLQTIEDSMRSALAKYKQSHDFLRTYTDMGK